MLKNEFDGKLNADDNKNEKVSGDDYIEANIKSSGNSEIVHSYLSSLRVYLNKFKGCADKKSPDRPPPHEVLASGVFGFIGILLVSVVSFWYLSKEFVTDNGTAVIILAGSYGATAVLLYDSHNSPLAQPRNVFGSYVVSSFLGVVARIICADLNIPQWVTAAFSVAFAVVGMNITRTVHPPAGAVALTAIVGGPGIVNMGFGFVATSAGGSLLMILFALLANNLMPDRHYPQYWW